jgi:hypothetical protein
MSYTIHASPTTTSTCNKLPGGPDGKQQCVLGFMAFDAGEGILPLWILGDTFIRTFYTTFNRATNEVWFADMA